MLGGEYITIGSDAHNPGDVGFGAFTVLKAAGIDKITVYKNRKPVIIPAGA
jgi:histidinol phosphatase-like PHP family hydrolase